jgi:Ca2+-binding RTX toxin-like protein
LIDTGVGPADSAFGRWLGVGGTLPNEAESGRDRLYGGRGVDTLWGRRRADVLLGGNGADILQAGSGADRLYGWAGDDVLKAAGDDGAVDSVEGGPGYDVCHVHPEDTVVRCEMIIVRRTG